MAITRKRCTIYVESIYQTISLRACARSSNNVPDEYQVQLRTRFQQRIYVTKPPFEGCISYGRGGMAATQEIGMLRSYFIYTPNRHRSKIEIGALELGV